MFQEKQWMDKKSKYANFNGVHFAFICIYKSENQQMSLKREKDTKSEYFSA